jgi:hypothetical protein
LPLSLVSAIKSVLIFEGPREVTGLLYVLTLYCIYLFITEKSEPTKHINAFEHPFLFASLAFIGLRYSLNFASRVLVLAAFRISAAVFRSALNSPGSPLVPLALSHALMPLGFLAVTGKPVTRNPYHLLTATIVGICFLGENPDFTQGLVRLALASLPVVHKKWFGQGIKSSPAPIPVHVEVGKSGFIETESAMELQDITIVDEDVLIGEIHDIVRVEV